MFFNCVGGWFSTQKFRIAYADLFITNMLVRISYRLLLDFSENFTILKENDLFNGEDDFLQTFRLYIPNLCSIMHRTGFIFYFSGSPFQRHM